MNPNPLRIFTLAAGLTVFAPATPARPTGQVDLAGPWQFSTNDQSTFAGGVPAEYANGTLNLPGVWEEQGFPTHDGYAWAVRDLDVKAGALPVALVVDGLLDEAQVFINGKEAGKLRGALGLSANLFPVYEPLRLDVSGLFKVGKNRIALRLHDNPVKGDWIWRGAPYPTAKGFGGVTGFIKLETAPEVYLRAVALWVTRKTLPESTFLFEVQTGNTTPRSVNGTLKLESSGNSVVKNVSIPTGGGKVELELRLPPGFGEKTWHLSLSAPGVADQITDTWHTVVVDTRDGKLWLNGEVFVIKGLNGHLPWDLQTGNQILDLIEDANVNLLRMAQGSHLWFRNFEKRQNLMVLPVSSGHYSCKTIKDWENKVPKKEFTYAFSATNELMDFVAQASRSPMLLGFNTLNEIETRFDSPDEKALGDILEAMRAMVQKADGYKHPSVYANLMWNAQRITEGQDMIGFNYYFEPEDFDFEQVRKLCGDRPFIFTETDVPIVYWKDPFVDNIPFHLDNHAKMIARSRAAGGSGVMLYSGLWNYHQRHPGILNGNWQTAKSLADFKIAEDYRQGIKFLFRDFDVSLVSGTWSAGQPVTIHISNLMPFALVGLTFQAGNEKTRAITLQPGETSPIDLVASEYNVVAQYETHRGLKHKTSVNPGKTYRLPKVDLGALAKPLVLPPFKPRSLQSLNGLATPAWGDLAANPTKPVLEMEKASPSALAKAVETVDEGSEGMVSRLSFAFGSPAGRNDWVRFKQNLPTTDLTGYDGVALRMKGDDKVRRYVLVLFDDKGKALDLALPAALGNTWATVYFGFKNPALVRYPDQAKEFHFAGLKAWRLQIDDYLVKEELQPEAMAKLHETGEGQIQIGAVALVKD